MPVGCTRWQGTVGHTRGHQLGKQGLLTRQEWLKHMLTCHWCVVQGRCMLRARRKSRNDGRKTGGTRRNAETPAHNALSHRQIPRLSHGEGRSAYITCMYMAQGTTWWCNALAPAVGVGSSWVHHSPRGQHCARWRRREEVAHTGYGLWAVSGDVGGQGLVF